MKLLDGESGSLGACTVSLSGLFCIPVVSVKLEVLNNVQVLDRYLIYLCHLSGHAGYVDMVAPRMKALLRSLNYEIPRNIQASRVVVSLVFAVLVFASPNLSS